MCVCVYVCMHACIHACMHASMHAWTDRWMDGPLSRYFLLSPLGHRVESWEALYFNHIKTTMKNRLGNLQHVLIAKVCPDLAKSYILKLSPKYTCYMTNTTSDMSRMSVIFTDFTYFPQDVSETHTSLHSTELQLILCYALSITYSMNSDLPSFNQGCKSL